jgi:hypothetical protein
MPEDHGSTSKSFVLLQAAHVKPSFRVLSIGLQGCLDVAYAALLLGRPCEFRRVLQHAELDVIRATEEYDAVVLGEALSKDKLNGAAQLIRRRWPRATILAVSAEPLDMDDALYDDRVLPGYNGRTLVAEVLRLAGRPSTTTHPGHHRVVTIEREHETTMEQEN